MKHLFSLSLLLAAVSSLQAQQKVVVTWPLNDLDNPTAVTVTGDTDNLLQTSYTQGEKLTLGTTLLTTSGADTGYTPITYDPPLARFQPVEKVSEMTDGHQLTFTINVAEGHTFKPIKWSFDAAKVGTDQGGLTVRYQSTGENELSTTRNITPLRNKITASNSTGYSILNFSIGSILIDNKSTFSALIYVNNIATNKEMALGNVVVEGMIDEPIYQMQDYLTSFTCVTPDGETKDLLSEVSYKDDGTEINLATPILDAMPTDFKATAVEGYTAHVTVENNLATVSVYTTEGERKYTINIRFAIRSRAHGELKSLNRGLVAVRTSAGNLISWRMRATDVPNQTRYVIYRDGQYLNETLLKTNLLDADAPVGATYKLEVYDPSGALIETQETVAWEGYNLVIPLAKQPVDTKGTGATYTPNDATCYDMDGDGEQEIVFKWEPTNVKDAASSGNTGAVWLECVKLDGTQLWRINLGTNIWASQHTVCFLCYDFDGDGYGELICKTAPGTIDGNGNYVSMGTDSPFESYVGGNGKIKGGPEYLTIFDGTTGCQLSTIDYYPAYRDGLSYGDSNDNRAFRFNATLARLNVNGKPTPCAVMNRGYYCQAYYMAAYYDGTDLHQLWRATYTTSGEGAYGEGYHTLQSGDVDDDGYDEIIVGSAVLDDDGSTLWRTGHGHGDALHIGEFDWDNPGLEVFSVKESKTGPYNATTCDARTGKLLFSTPQTGSDTGRGVCGDFDPTHDGAEYIDSSDNILFSSKGDSITKWKQGDYPNPNFRIYWDGDLYEEHHDRTHVSKWSATDKRWNRLETFYLIGPGTNSCNSTKYVPNLQADILGDWREEVVYWCNIDSINGYFGLNLITTPIESEYMLPYLRDDALYDNAIAWQNSTYNQPPHLSYSPVLYWEELQKQIAATHIATLPSESAEPTFYHDLYGRKVAAPTSGGVFIHNRQILIK